MIELTSLDRLRIHLSLHHSDVRLNHVKLSKKPGFLLVRNKGRIDIRKASYPADSHPLRLWEELHDELGIVAVLKKKNGQATLIEYNGAVYHLDKHKTYAN